MPDNLWELKPENLRAACDINTLGFETTSDLAPLKFKVVAQGRAQRALEFGLGIKDQEYNIYVAGPRHARKTETIKDYVSELAAKEPCPPDYLYVHNFKEPERPRSLVLPTGRGRTFKTDMEELLTNLKIHVPEIFESEEYNNRREGLVSQFTKERNAILQELDTRANQEGFILNISPTGLMLFPGKEGKPMSRRGAQGPERRGAGVPAPESLQCPARRDERGHRARSADGKGVPGGGEEAGPGRGPGYVVGHNIEELREKYQDYPQVTEYLKEVQEDILKNIDDFKKKSGGPEPLALSHAGAQLHPVPGERLRGQCRDARARR